MVLNQGFEINDQKIGSWDLDIHSQKMFFSDQACSILGVERDTLLVLSKWLGLFSKESSLLLQRAFDQCKLENEPFDLSFPFHAHSNGKLWISITGVAVSYEGKVQKIAGTVKDITDSRQWNDAVLQSEKKYHSMVQHATDIITLVDKNGTILYASKEIINITGFAGKELVGRPIMEMIHPDDRQEAGLKFVTGVSSKGIGPAVTYKFRKKSGGYVLLESQGSNQLDNPAINAIVVYSKEVTDRVMAENMLKESEELYKYFFYNNPSPMFIWDIDAMDIVECNMQVSNKYGYSREEFLRLSISDLRPKEDIPEDIQGDKEVMAGELGPRLWRHLKKDGSIMYVNITANLIEYKGKICSFVLVDDITDQLEAEEQLLTSLKELSSYKFALDESSIVSITDKQGVINYVNKNFCNISEYTLGELVGKTHKIGNSGFHSRAFFKEMWQTISTGKVWRGEIKNRTKSGSYYWVDTTIVPFLDNEGNTYQYMSIRFDITAKKHAEIALNERQQFIETALDNLPIGIAVNNIKEGKATLMNRKFGEIYGWPMGELTDVQDFFEKVYPDPVYREKIRQQILVDIESKETSQMNWEGITITTKTGENRIVNVKNIPLYDQNLMISTVLDVTEKVTFEKKLKTSNERYEYVTKAVFDTIWDWDLIEDKIYWSEGFEKVFGHKVADLTTTASYWRKNVHPDDIDRINDSLEKAFQNGRDNWTEEYLYLKSNGQYANVLDHGIIIRDESGKAFRMIGAIQDITKKKLKEEQLRLMESVVSNNKDGILITKAMPLDAPGPQIIYANHAFKKMTGYTMDEIIGKNPRFLQGPKTDKKEIEKLSSALKAFQPYTIEVVNYKKNGEPFWVDFSISPVADKNGLFTHFIAIERDVSERKTRDFHKNILSNISGVFNEPVELNCILYKVLEVLVEMGEFNWAEAWLLDSDQSRLDLVAVKGSFAKNPSFGPTSLNQEEGLPGKVWKKKKMILLEEIVDDKVLVCQNLALENGIKKVLGVPLYFKEAVLGVLVLAWDDQFFQNEYFYNLPKELSIQLGPEIRRKQAETQLKILNEELSLQAKELAASNAELEQFAYIASHDLQEPLRMVSGFLSQLEKKYNPLLDEKGKKYIGFAVDGAAQMRQIILDLLEYSRIGRVEEKIEDVDVSKLIETIAATHKKTIEEKKARIKWANLPTVKTAKIPLQQLFQNLIGNAFKYQEENNRPEIEVAAKESETHWEFAVKDNGIGIDPVYFGRIFTVFQRLHNKDEYSGTGIGLAICKKIVENFGGTIWVESEEGKGSTFYFTISKDQS